VTPEKRPTWTHLVTEALRTADDFRSFAELRAATGASVNQLGAALWHLQKCKVVESVGGPGGLFWFYTGAGDTRCREIGERTPEDKPRRVRRVRKEVK
jgi:hypothetical protein